MTIGAKDGAAVEEARRRIELILDPPKAEVGQVYAGRVVNITKFGAFVNILPGRDGLLHISKLGRGTRVERVEDVVDLGDEVTVRVDDVDPQGKVSLSCSPTVQAPARSPATSTRTAGNGAETPPVARTRFRCRRSVLRGDLGGGGPGRVRRPRAVRRGSSRASPPGRTGAPAATRGAAGSGPVMAVLTTRLESRDDRRHRADARRPLGRRRLLGRHRFPGRGTGGVRHVPFSRAPALQGHRAANGPGHRRGRSTPWEAT